MTYPTVTEAIRAARVEVGDDGEVWLHSDDRSMTHEDSMDCPCEPVEV